MNKKLPQRPDSHVMEESSNRFFVNALPTEWITNRPTHDYGIDFSIEIVDHGFVTGLNFSVQLKSKKKENSKSHITVPIEHSTLNYFNVRLEPTLIVVYLIDENEAFWYWFNDLEIDLSKPEKNTFQIKLPRANKLSNLKWSKIQDYVQKIFSRKALFSNLPLIDYSNITDMEKSAWQSFYNSNYEDAAFYFKKLLSLNPPSLIWLNTLGTCQYITYQYQDALRTINQAIELFNDESSILNKACILAEIGIATGNKVKLIEAKDIFKLFINSYPNEAEYHYNFANTLSNLKESRLAEKHYKKALSINPNKAEAWKNLGQVYYDLGVHNKEIDCYNKAIGLNPKLSPALMSKGITLAHIFKKYEHALDLMLNALECDPNIEKAFPITDFWLAYVYDKLAQFDNSLNWINRGLLYNPGDPRMMNFKSNLLYKIWRTSTPYKEATLAFATYRFEIEKDWMSLYTLLLIQKEDGKVTEKYFFDEITSKTPFLSDITFQKFLELNIKMSDHIDCIPFIDRYAHLRNQHPLSRYAEHILSPHFSISTEFWQLLDFTFGCSYSRAHLRSKENENVNALMEGIANDLVSLLPVITPLLVNRKKRQNLVSTEIMATIMTGIHTIGLRELGLQAGSLAVHLKPKGPHPKIADGKFKNFADSLVTETLLHLNQKMKVLREE